VGLRVCKTALLARAMALLAPGLAQAEAAAAVEEVVVFGRGEAKIGIAQAASEGTVGGSDLPVRPLLRVTAPSHRAYERPASTLPGHSEDPLAGAAPISGPGPSSAKIPGSSCTR
jgi:hypothetical protein